MKVLKLTLLTLSVCLTTCAFAQYDDYLLKDYFNPNYQRQMLNFYISGGLNNGSLKEGVVDDFVYTDRTDFDFNGLLRANYNSVKNTIKTQNSTYFGLSLGGNFEKNNSDSETLNKIGNFGLGLDFRHRGYYYNTRKQFLLVQPIANLGYNYNNNKYNTNSSDSKSTVNNFQTLFSIGIGVGLGRIEEVGDARQAIYILQELQKQKLLKKELSAEKINELAQLITTVKNKRQFDSRIKLIEEITTVDSFFVANDFIDKDHSTAYFTTLYDNWQYANVSRQSGNRFTVGVTPSGVYNSLHRKESYNPHYTIESDRDTWNLGADFFVSFESEKPINLKWQQSFFAKYTLGTNREIIDDDGQSIHSTTLMASYGLGFYPNSRTEIKGSLSQDIDYLFNESGSTWATTTALNFQMSYYFSPQLRLSLSYRAGFDYYGAKNKYFDRILYSKNKYPTNVLSFGLSYSLF